MTVVVGILTGIFGLAVGSFLNVCVYRLPRGKSVISPRSACPSCGRELAWFENIPLLSYLFLRGKCRSCRVPISPRYPALELLTAGIFLWVYFFSLSGRFDLALGWPVFFRLPRPLDFAFLPFLWYLGASLLCLSAIDLEHQIIPDLITYPLAAFGLALIAWVGLGAGVAPGRLALRVAVGAAAGGGSLWLLGLLGRLALRKEAMGMGDVKLMAAAGIWLGWEMTLFAVFLGALSGAAAALVLLLAGRKQMGQRLPFGPFLSLGIWVSLLYGWRLLYWYLAFYRP